MAEKVPVHDTHQETDHDPTNKPVQEDLESEKCPEQVEDEAKQNAAANNSEADLDRNQIDHNKFENAERGDNVTRQNKPSGNEGDGVIPMDQDRTSVGNQSRGGGGPGPESTMDPGEALEALMDQLGHFGFYQRLVMTLICFANVLAAMYSLNYVFVADQVPFRCVVPECEGTVNVQFDNASAAALQSPLGCRRYQPLTPDQLTCERDSYSNETIACDAFVYENMDTIYAEFGLACEEWRRTLVGSVRNAALPLALLLTGYLSDGWGRRTAFCVFAACAGALGLLKSLALNYYMYLAMEFLEAALGYGFNSAAYVMMMELARPSLRASFACATGVAYGAGGALLALLAARVHPWRALLRALHAPALLLPPAALLLDESARWLHATRRTDRAIAVLRKAAAYNKVILNEALIAAAQQPQQAAVAARGRWLGALRSRALLGRFALCGWCWAAAAFVYYGLTINSVSLAGDKYVNFALNMAMEIVASLLLVMALERCGRKRTIFAAFALCGVACVVPYFTAHSGMGLGLFFVGKLSATCAFNSLYVFTAELFPTAGRASALAATSLLGRAGSILAPQTPLLKLEVQALLYGGCALSAALLVLLAPETRCAALPAGVQDAERIGETVHTPKVPLAVVRSGSRATRSSTSPYSSPS